MTFEEVQEVVDGAGATALRFEYKNAVGEYHIDAQRDWAKEMKASLVGEYGQMPLVTAVVFAADGKPDTVAIEQVRARVREVSDGPSARSSVERPMAHVRMAGRTQQRHAPINAAGASPAWYPSWSRPQAQVLGNGTREIVVSLEWAGGRSPGGGKWRGTRGLEVETNLFNPSVPDEKRRPGPTNLNNCPDKDRGFWTARKWDSQVDFWALESPQGLDVGPAKPYFDGANYTDSCQWMSQTVGIGIPERLPEQPGNPG